MDNKENSEKKENIEIKEEDLNKVNKEKTDSFKVKKSHLVIVLVLIILVIGVVMGLIYYGKNSNKDLAAEVNGEKISLASINKEYEKIPADQRPMVKRMDLLNQTIVTTLLLQEAKKNKIEVSNEEVDNVINGIQLPAGQSIEAILTSQGFTFDEFKAKIKEQLVIQQLLNNTIKIDVNDTEISDYFDKNKDQLKQQLSVNASHILVNSSEEANEIIKDLKKGKSFEELAKEKSIDPGSKDNGGNLGLFPKGVMIKEFEDSAFELEVGEISKPVKTTFGYHIIKVNERFEDKDATLEDSRDKIIEIVKKEKSGDAAVEYIRNLYTNAKIKIYLKEA